MMRHLLPVILVVSCAAWTHAQDAIVQAKGAATLEIRHDGKGHAMALSDLIKVDLRVDGSEKLQVDPPKESPDGWTLVRRSTVKTERLKDSRVRWQLTQWYSPQTPGNKVAFQFPAVKYEDSEDEQTVKFAPIEFSVTTQIASPDVALLRDKTQIEALPPIAQPDASQWWWLGFSVPAVILAILFMAACRFWRRAPPATAGQLALQEWQRLMELRLPEKGRSERFMTLLSLLVRLYLERQYALPARRRTTQEFLRQFVQVTSLTEEEKQFLTSFLKQSEHVKFAQLPLSAEECVHWANEVRRFIDPAKVPDA